MENKKIIIIVQARYGSTRFPGKIFQNIDKKKRIIDLILEYSQVKLVLMHNLGIHANPKMTIQSHDHLGEIKKWAEEKIINLKEHGIKHDRIIFDPGIGFGKTKEQSLDVIKLV